MNKDFHTYAGTCHIDISPSLPVALVGQYYKRIATEIFTPLTASVIAVASTNPANEDSMIIVSCDLLGIPRRLMQAVRIKVSMIDSSIDVDKIIINAIHTHTGPYIYNDNASYFWGSDFDYTPMFPNEQNPEEYGDTLSTKIANAIVFAWTNKKPVKMATGYDYVSLAYNRRTVYQDGHAEMYGSTGRSDFKQIEGPTDSGIHFMSFSDMSDKMTAIAINIPCPAQVLEHKSFVASDFWHEIRKDIHQKYGDSVVVIALTGAAGDLSPRDLVRMAREEPLMHTTTMYNVEGTMIISKRVVRALDDFWNKKHDESEEIVLHHTTKFLNLPLRTTTKAEAEEAKKLFALLRAKHIDMSSFSENESMWLSIYAGCIKRYEMQQEKTTYPVEVHCIEFGSAIITTNPFELYLYYADRIRSKTSCENTFVVQLACGYDGYLPTQEAIERGGYSSYLCNGCLGSEGGEELVRETLDCLTSSNSS